MSSGSNRMPDEFKQFLDAPNLPQKENPIKFWVDTRHFTPILSGLALKYLIPTASSVPSERVASAVNLAVPNNRSRLTAEQQILDNVIFHASGDGAAGGCCCRLCGGDVNLRSFGTVYMWQGLEERYDQLLYDCFGVEVTPADSLICEWCVRQLRSADRFRTMVRAAFEKSPSPSTRSAGSGSSNNYRCKAQEPAIISYKDIIELLSTKSYSETEKAHTQKFYEKHRDSLIGKNEDKRLRKKTSAQCTRCKQRYSCVSLTRGKKFICDKCKNRKDCEKRTVCKRCNAAIPYGLMREHIGLHVKANMRGKSRVALPKQPSQGKQEVQKIRSIPKFRCPVCPKRYMTTQHLAEHIKCMHGGGKKSFCEICGKDLKNNEPFEKHIQVHTDQILNYRCPPKLLRTKRALKTLHYVREKTNV